MKLLFSFSQVFFKVIFFDFPVDSGPGAFLSGPRIEALPKCIINRLAGSDKVQSHFPIVVFFKFKDI